VADLGATILCEIGSEDTPAKEALTKKKKKTKKVTYSLRMTLRTVETFARCAIRRKAIPPRRFHQTIKKRRRRARLGLSKCLDSLSRPRTAPSSRRWVSYSTYHLDDTSQAVDVVVTGRINACLKKLKRHIDAREIRQSKSWTFCARSRRRAI
jgi:hypothetical protein